MDKIDVLTRGVVEILPNKESLSKLISAKKIRIYLGIDPTGPRLHLGHTIPLRKLQAFANLGHEAILVMGTGTVLAGDPSQRKEARKAITKREIEENIKDWKRQAAKVLDFQKITIKENADWLLKLTLADILKIASQISSVQLFKREMFQERIKRGDTVFTHETLYPLLQGYDSVHLDVDAEIGGTDQTFNMLIGRELQKKMNSRDKFVITTPMISGTDGKQMTKTAGNCIWLDDTAEDMYAKILSMSDSQIEEYWLNLTDMDKSELESTKPLDAKKKLAREIVRLYSGEQDSKRAEESFESLVQKKDGHGSVPELKLDKGNVELVEFLVENSFSPSRSEAKRLIRDGAVEVDGQTISDSEYEFSDNQIIRVGKKKFVRIKVD